MQRSPNRMFLVLMAVCLVIGMTLSPGHAQLTFDRQDIASGTNPRGIVTLDLNNNGARDLIVTNETSNSFTILSNSGTGAFTSAGEINNIGDTPTTALTADLNNDGQDEVIVLTPGSGELRVFRNNAGALELSFTITGFSYPSAVAVTDLNGDERPDMVIANRGIDGVINNLNHIVVVLLQQADGTFVSPTGGPFDDPAGIDGLMRISQCCVFPNSLVTGNFNNDTLPDVVITQVGGRDQPETRERINVARNTGNATEPLPSTSPFFHPGGQAGPQEMTNASDFDREGLVLGFFEPECNPDGNSQNEDCHTFSVTAADFNNDGRLDLAVANEFGGDTIIPIPIRPADGNTFEEVTALTYWTAQHVFLRADTNSSGTNRALRRLTAGGEGTLIGTLDHVSKGLAFSTDATPVLYSISPNDDQLRVVNPENAATVSNVAITLTGESVVGGRGLATHPTTGVLWGLLETGGEELVLATINPTTGAATRIGSPGNSFAGLAFDNTGALYGITEDLNDTRQSAILFTLSTTDATASPSGVFLRSHFERQAMAFNPQDGRLYHASGFDAEEVNSTSSGVFESIDQANIQGRGKVTIFINNGDDTFTPSDLNIVAGAGPIFVTHADLDGVNGPDLIVVNRNANNISVWRNNGDGTFAEAQTIAVGTSPRAVVAADLDGDGDMDLAVANRDSNNVSILLNRTNDPILTVVPQALDFETVVIAMSSDIRITISNDGGTALELETPTIDAGNAFRVVSTTCASTQALARGDFCEVVVQFAPTTVGAQDGTLTLASNVAASPTLVPLTGTGLGVPGLTPDLTAVDFGDVSLQPASPPTRTVRVTSSGSAALTFAQAPSVSGSGFSVVSTTCTSTQALAPDDFCEVVIQFAPTTVGAQDGTLTLASNVAASPTLVPLTGTGLGVPSLTLDPTAVAFGGVSLQPASPPTRTVRVTSSGSAALTFAQAPSVSGSGFSVVSTTCTSTQALAPDTFCEVVLQFAPTTVGAQDGTLTLASNAAASPTLVPLTGTGLGVPGLTPDLTAVDFGDVPIASQPPPTRTVRVTNSGSVVLTLQAPGVSGLGFSLASTTCTPVQVLDTDAVCEIVLQFAPTTVGVQNGALTIRLAEQNILVLEVPLRGTGDCTVNGDVDGSAIVTPGDALQAFQHFLNPLDFPLDADECQRIRADVSSPGASGITPADARCIFQVALGITSCLGQ